MPSACIPGQPPTLLGPALSAALGWKDCTILRLTVPADESVGVLCLADRGKPVPPADEQLLHAIASHASVALENARLFTRMDKANRHWMEIFDAITDFIVVHDEAQQRPARQPLAGRVHRRPAQRTDRRQHARTVALASDAPLPVVPSAATPRMAPTNTCIRCSNACTWSRLRAFTPSAGEGQHTIHVLKDITDRREAERRYRELFDNIQEGLFFAVPDGHFIEVNDALVRMLGYADREELLQDRYPDAALHFARTPAAT